GYLGGGDARALRGNQRPLGGKARRNLRVADLRYPAHRRRVRLERALSWPAPEVVRDPLHGQRQRNQRREPGRRLQARVRVLWLVTEAYPARPARAVQAPGL